MPLSLYNKLQINFFEAILLTEQRYLLFKRKLLELCLVQNALSPETQLTERAFVSKKIMGPDNEPSQFRL
jgi:hypothetical protein